MSARFEKIGTETIYKGKFLDVRRDRFRFEDGEEVDRELVGHPGAVGVVVLDGEENLWFVRQPREAIGIPDLLEIPAGKLDVEGENSLEAAKRELAEEIGKQATQWESLGSFYTSPGFADEEIHLFLATGGASDANVLEAAGIATVNIANGTEHNHEPTERVSVAALDSMLDVAFSLLDEAAVA